MFLEASTVAGAVKPVLEFAREAAENEGGRAINMVLVLYVRARQENKLLDLIRDKGISIEAISERRAFDLRVISQLQDLARTFQPDIVWTNNTKSHFLVFVSGLYKSAKWIAFHHGYTKEAWRTRVYDELDRFSLPHAERVVTVCNDFAHQLQRKGVPANRIRVVRNPIRPSSPVTEAEKNHVRDQLGLESVSVLLSVGRLSAEKGHADLLQAMKRLRDARSGNFHSRLVLVGDGPERRNLETLCAKLKLQDCVIFTGHHPDVRPYYEIAHVFILPSHSEGSPNVLLEAVAAGLPIVATAVGGLPEVLSHEVNALLVPRQNPEQLAIAIARVLDDSQLRHQLADQANEMVGRHSPHAYFRSVIDIFNEVAGESGAK